MILQYRMKKKKLFNSLADNIWSVYMFFFVFILLNKILPIKNKFEQTKHTFCFRRWDCNWATEWLTAFAISIYRNFVYIGMRYASVYVYAIRLYVSLVRLLDLWRVGIEAPLYWQFVMRSVNQHAYSEQESPVKNEKKPKIAHKTNKHAFRGYKCIRIG